MSIVRRVTLVATVLALATVGLAATSSAGTYQPDSGAKKGKYSPVAANYTGFGVYSYNTSGQTVKARVRAGRSKIFSFMAFNAGSVADDFTVVSCTSDGPVKIKWLALSAPDRALPGAGPLRPTAGPDPAVAQRGALTGVAPGTGAAFSMKASVHRKFEGRGVFRCFFEVESAGAPSLTDRSLAKFKVTG